MILNNSGKYQAIIDYYKKHKIKEFLQNNPITGKQPIYFMSDPTLTEAFKQAMGDKYSDADMSLIAVVEVGKGEGIVIGDKNYQPIAIMSGNNSTTNKGAQRLAPFRELASSQEEGTIIKGKDDKPIKTFGKVIANPPRHLSKDESNNSLRSIMMNDMSEEDKKQLADDADPSPIVSNKQKIYNKYKKAFISHIKKNWFLVIVSNGWS